MRRKFDLLMEVGKHFNSVVLQHALISEIISLCKSDTGKPVWDPEFLRKYLRKKLQVLFKLPIVEMLEKFTESSPSPRVLCWTQRPMTNPALGRLAPYVNHKP